jgi:hypothetical protein
MSGDPANEVRLVVQGLLEHLRPIAEKHPGEVMSTTEFNQALSLAKKAFGGSATIGGMQAMHDSMGHDYAKAIDVVSRLAALDAAISANRPR